MTRTPAHTGLPDVDPLIDARDAEQAEFDRLAAATQAADTADAVRRGELLAEQTAAARRVSAARGRLTRAQRDGGAEKILAARKRLDAAHADFDRISKANIAEMRALNTAQSRRLDALFAQMRRTWEAGDAVIDALARPARPEPEETCRSRDAQQAAD